MSVSEAVLEVSALTKHYGGVRALGGGQGGKLGRGGHGQMLAGDDMAQV